MNLSSTAERKLKAWYGPDTWHTDHDLDMNRWYDFVSQYRQDLGFTVDEAGLREHIEHKIKDQGQPIGDDLSQIIRERISLMYLILDFLKQTGR
jgi:hypothetical protein